MNKSKQETTLCEKDALQDMLDHEKQLLTFYTTALTEGSSKAFRKEITRAQAGCADNQYTLYEQMLSRGYYEVMPAEKLMIDKKTEIFGKVKKQICAN